MLPMYNVLSGRHCLRKKCFEFRSHLLPLMIHSTMIYRSGIKKNGTLSSWYNGVRCQTLYECKETARVQFPVALDKTRSYLSRSRYKFHCRSFSMCSHLEKFQLNFNNLQLQILSLRPTLYNVVEDLDLTLYVVKKTNCFNMCDPVGIMDWGGVLFMSLKIQHLWGSTIFGSRRLLTLSVALTHFHNFPFSQ